MHVHVHQIPLRTHADGDFPFFRRQIDHDIANDCRWNVGSDGAAVPAHVITRPSDGSGSKLRLQKLHWDSVTTL